MTSQRQTISRTQTTHYGHPFAPDGGHHWSLAVSYEEPKRGRSVRRADYDDGQSLAYNLDEVNVRIGGDGARPSVGSPRS